MSSFTEHSDDVSNEDILFLIIRHLRGIGMFATVLTLLRESGLDDQWVCGPTYQLALLREWVFTGAFTNAINFLTPLELVVDTQHIKEMQTILKCHGDVDELFSPHINCTRRTNIQKALQVHPILFTEASIDELLNYTHKNRTTNFRYEKDSKSYIPVMDSMQARWRLLCFERLVPYFREAILPDEVEYKYTKMPHTQLAIWLSNAILWHAKTGDNSSAHEKKICSDLISTKIQMIYCNQLENIASKDKCEATTRTTRQFSTSHCLCLNPYPSLHFQMSNRNIIHSNTKDDIDKLKNNKMCNSNGQFLSLSFKEFQKPLCHNVTAMNRPNSILKDAELCTSRDCATTPTIQQDDRNNKYNPSVSNRSSQHKYSDKSRLFSLLSYRTEHEGIDENTFKPVALDKNSDVDTIGSCELHSYVRKFSGEQMHRILAKSYSSDLDTAALENLDDDDTTIYTANDYHRLTDYTINDSDAITEQEAACVTDASIVDQSHGQLTKEEILVGSTLNTANRISSLDCFAGLKSDINILSNEQKCDPLHTNLVKETSVAVVPLTLSSLGNIQTTCEVANYTRYSELSSILRGHEVAAVRETQAIRAMEISFDGSTVAIGTNARALRIFDLTEICRANRNTTSPHMLRKLDPSDTDATTETKAQISRNSTESLLTSDLLPLLPVVFERHKHHQSAIYCLAYDSTLEYNSYSTCSLMKSKPIATGDADSSIKVIVPSIAQNYDGKIEATISQQAAQTVLISGHKGRCRGLVFSNPGILVSSCSGDEVVRMWDIQHMVDYPIMQFTGHTNEILTLTTSLSKATADSVPLSPSIFSGARDNTIRRWDTRVGKCVQILPIPVNSEKFSPYIGACALKLHPKLPDVLVSGHQNGLLRIWDLRIARPQTTYDHNWNSQSNKECRALSWSPDGRWLASGGFDGNISIWDTNHTNRNLSLISTSLKHQDKVLQLQWHPIMPLIVSTGADKVVKVWKFHT